MKNNENSIELLNSLRDKGFKTIEIAEILKGALKIHTYKNKKDDNTSKCLNKLMVECESRNYNCSITYQKINGYSVEIYQGYGKIYKLIFAMDGYLTTKKTIKKGIKFLN